MSLNCGDTTPFSKGSCHRVFQTISHEPQGVHEIALAGGIGSDQHIEMTERYSGLGNASKVLNVDMSQHPRSPYDYMVNRSRNQLISHLFRPTRTLARRTHINVLVFIELAGGRCGLADNNNKLAPYRPNTYVRAGEP